MKLSLFLWWEKVLTVLGCLFATITIAIQIFCPFLDLGIPAIVVFFCVVIMDIGFYVFAFHTYMQIKFDKGVFISRGVGIIEHKIPLSEIERLQMNYNPDSNRFIIEILLHDGSIKTVNWDNAPRYHGYSKQKDRCAIFIEKCNAALSQCKSV